MGAGDICNAFRHDALNRPGIDFDEIGPRAQGGHRHVKKKAVGVDADIIAEVSNRVDLAVHSLALVVDHRQIGTLCKDRHKLVAGPAQTVIHNNREEIASLECSDSIAADRHRWRITRCRDEVSRKGLNNRIACICAYKLMSTKKCREADYKRFAQNAVSGDVYL